MAEINDIGTQTDLRKDVLKDHVFVASLIGVLTDVFGSAKDLYHKLKQQSTCDDDDITQRDKHASNHDHRDSHPNILESVGRHVRWSLDQRARHYSDREDDLICNASAQVQTTYDRAYRKIGELYARGDDIARIQLQSQIIKLQQVLISIHQDFGLSNYLTIASSHSQLIYLVQTVRTTRAAAIQALDLLYQRLLAEPRPGKPDPRPSMPGGFPTAPKKPHRSRSSSSSSSDTPVPVPLKPTPRPEPKPVPAPAPCPAPKPNPNLNKLFCRYALDLQYNPHLPLSHHFYTNGDRRCPHCRTFIPVRPNKAWEIVMLARGRHPRRMKFLVRNEFVVKCHRVGGGFACVLCAKYGDADTVCRDVGDLMEHLWREHTCEDLERDEDIVGG
ncbi:uncharacterized protein M421DRAFT_97206 [Didymella exigua CBS 183.55]|uniref:Uncharacterized protein n=1 Tax=Didymella exigua CBS 183.55 TaxID=1150837 RepID=A0A6A5S4H5_9PLEO|nr:uncharacterized protein M421DRAFT_97206 [Didymella exigua CBS 183.55]KAF1934248.1 hypothetical protein M421DRAFT_97206 [Didymella exigua CBS 183.55]